MKHESFFFKLDCEEIQINFMQQNPIIIFIFMDQIPGRRAAIYSEEFQINSYSIKKIYNLHTRANLQTATYTHRKEIKLKTTIKL